VILRYKAGTFGNAKECDFESLRVGRGPAAAALTAGWLCGRPRSEGPLCAGTGIRQQAAFLPGARCHCDRRESTKPERSGL